MANLPFAADLSLGPLGSRRDDDLRINSGLFNSDAFVVKDCDSWAHCKQGLGKKSEPAGYEEYLGAFPVLKTTNGTSPVGSDPFISPESISSQLTLFYAGTVKVFENVTADKAVLIMSLAGGNNSPLQATDTVGLTGPLLKGPDMAFMQPSLTCSVQVQNPLQKMLSKAREIPSAAENSQVLEEGQAKETVDYLVPCQAVVPKALPLARKESLARFLERRKDRVQMKGPYQRKEGQGVSCSKASTQMQKNGLWTAPSMYTFAELLHGKGASAEGKEWVTGYEPGYEYSKQVSEGESAT